VIGVGGTTQGGCLGSYSLSGKGVDIVAPGGGIPATGCPSILSSPIFQITFKGDSRRSFGQPADYVGTSMAAAHVSGVAAMVLASTVIPRPRKSARLVRQVTSRLLGTARSLGLSRAEQGGGLLDAGAATDPSVSLPG
jgi:serine protease